MRKIKPHNQHPRETDPNEESEAQEIEVPEAAAELFHKLETERDEAIAARQRALADFANYQRRAADNEVRARQQGATNVIRSILTVLDHFDLALGQDPKQTTVEQILGGVKIVRSEFTKALESHGVRRIDPAVGDEFDPAQHEAVMQQTRPGIEPNHITAVLQAGYALGDYVLRPAKVAVAPCEPDADDEPGD